VNSPHSGEVVIEVEIEDSAWTAAQPDAEALAIAAATAALDRPGEIAVLLSDDATLRDLNNRFRGKDKPTNVLSFPAPSNPQGHLGDIALAYGVCAAEAAEQGKSLSAHLQHLVAHGVLHLVGFDHETEAEAEAMEAQERVILAGLGVSDPYAVTAMRP
jgi:probable rRNA maturation factor